MKDRNGLNDVNTENEYIGFVSNQKVFENGVNK